MVIFDFVLIILAAAFALIGALDPTDDVAVGAVAKRIAVPRKTMGILSGESIINDASGIICFQFAILAMTTGSFSLKQASLQFILLGLGGLLAGISHKRIFHCRHGVSIDGHIYGFKTFVGACNNS